MSSAPPATPTRRANVPSHIKEWIYNKVVQFAYYDGAHTIEVKQLFIGQLTKKLNERYSAETGAWDEVAHGHPGKENSTLSVAAAAATAACAAPPVAHRPIQRLLRDWQATLLAASALNAATLARHTSNKGSCNEALVRGFLAAVLGSRLIGIGSGELLSHGEESSPPRQVDVLLYDTAFPALRPATIVGNGDSSSSCACYYPESVLAIIEVKTTLTNQDLRDVCRAAELLGPTTPFFIFAFDSQSTMRAIDVSGMPENVLGIYTLSHGSIVRCEEGWRIVLPPQRQPLEQFYANLLDVLSLEESLQRVVGALRRHLEEEDVAVVVEEEHVQANLEVALSAVDLNAGGVANCKPFEF